MAAAIKPQMQTSQQLNSQQNFHMQQQQPAPLHPSDEVPMDNVHGDGQQMQMMMMDSGIQDHPSNIEEMSLAGADREAQSIKIRKI